MPALNVQSALAAGGGTSTTSTTFVDGTVLDLPGGIPSGVDYFIAYRANFGGNDAAQVGQVRLLQVTGSVELGLTGGEGIGNSNHWDTGQLQGFARVTTGAVSDNFSIQHRNVTSSDTNYLGSRAIVAIPIGQNSIIDEFDGSVIQEQVTLTQDYDYFYSGTNSGTAEVSSVGNTWTTVRTVDFAINTAGDYRVFFSCEATLAGGSATDGAQCRFQIDASNISPEFVHEWEDDEDRPNFAWSKQVNLTAASHTFRVQVQNRNSSSIVSAYRSRIWAFRNATFAAGAYSTLTSGDSAITHTSYSDSEVVLDTSMTSKNPGRVVCFASVNLGYSGGVALAELKNAGGTERSVDAGRAYNDSGLDSGDDLMPTVLMMEDGTNRGEEPGYRVRHRLSAAGTGTIGRNAGNTANIENNLMIWHLFVEQHDVSSIISQTGVVTTTPQ